MSIILADDETDTTSTNVNVIGEVSVRDYKVTTIDHVLAKVENVEDFSSENTFDTFSASSFDSAWYHVICKDATNNAFSMHKFSVCHGTSSDSSAEAFITDSGELRSETVPVITSNADVNDGNVRVRVTAHNDGSSAISVGMAAYRIGLGDNDSTGGIALAWYGALFGFAGVPAWFHLVPTWPQKQKCVNRIRLPYI